SDAVSERAFAEDPRDKRSFSPWRIGKVTAAFLIVGVLGSVPGAVIQVWQASQEADRQEQSEQQKLNRSMQDIRQAVREGKAGKAFQRLFKEEHEEFLRKKASEVPDAKPGSEFPIQQPGK